MNQNIFKNIDTERFSGMMQHQQKNNVNWDRMPTFKQNNKVQEFMFNNQFHQIGDQVQLSNLLRFQPSQQNTQQNTLPKLKNNLYKDNQSTIQFPDQFQPQMQMLTPQMRMNYKYIQKIPRCDDDEQLIQKQSAKLQNKNKYDLQSSIAFEINSLRTSCKVSNYKSEYIPAMISIKTKENQTEMTERTIGIDLICLIDKSMSMSGDNINMVKKSLLLLLDFLGEQDRLQIITFNEHAQRLTPLKCLTEKNKQYFQAVISQISAEGLTKISSATYIAFKQLKEKVYRNNVTSVFLLSDGHDGDALFEISDQIRHVKEVFTISTFGFGDDHDAQMMTSISNLKNGNFYYVKDITLLDEFFAHALGGIVSVIAEQIQISLSLTLTKPLQDVQISKTYGNMWKKREHAYEINIPQLASGTRKDFVFEIQIPYIYSKIQDQERVVKVLEARLKLKDPLSGEIIQKSAALNLTLFNENENVGVIEENIDVYSQYMRVKGTQAIDDAKRACEQNNFEDAQRLLDDMTIQISKKNNKVVLECAGIIQDLNQAKEATKSISYNSYGSKQLCQIVVNNNTQGGMNSVFSLDGQQQQQLNPSQYSNLTQQTMLKMVQTKKAKY
ncbi:unnamed protein product (macronuclear) [Paramecium tetraurelia]|uniref:VWFA domain-containing protein n=1 Tax=Paramecium tetraurelia TaxID=5888 RepID=A0C5K4_PARTE|nr:uncharacterized protein GSPATT00035200001 [Paramecium tetraurelia]CAK66071.1 unnamed protein product [Paramecium tetraurelia]|eukprot:XP_001433468.1 hypothetical protein (macronuclear) [Paramecium tetraurelia strain d4-2]